MARSSDYILPDGNVQISFSGGRTSGYLLHQILEANGNLPDRVKVMFANTGREMPETLDFVQECSERWSVPITWIEYRRKESKVSYDVVSHNSASRNGEPFEILIAAKKYLPNVVTRFCTTELKIRPMKKYLVDAGWDRWTAAVGIRADEARRAKNDSKDRWSYWYPLLDAGVTKKTISDFWAGQDFDLRLNNAAGTTPMGNCDMCFLKSEATLAMMSKLYPDRAQWWIDMEEMAGSTFRKDRNLKQFVSFAEAQQDWVFDQQGYFCQQDEGECVP